MPHKPQNERHGQRPNRGHSEGIVVAQYAETKHSCTDDGERDLRVDNRHVAAERSKNLRTPARKSSDARDSTLVATPAAIPC